MIALRSVPSDSSTSPEKLDLLHGVDRLEIEAQAHSAIGVERFDLDVLEAPETEECAMVSRTSAIDNGWPGRVSIRSRVRRRHARRSFHDDFGGHHRLADKRRGRWPVRLGAGRIGRRTAPLSERASSEDVAHAELDGVGIVARLRDHETKAFALIVFHRDDLVADTGGRCRRGPASR